MRFTKIPLIATLMAVALSLLIVLPTLAQVSGDRTDGRLSVGDWIDVRVADKLTGDIISTATDPATTVVGTSGAHAVGATAYEAKDTYFNGDLYVSNKEKAFNTILITAKVAGDAGVAPLAKVDDTATTEEMEGPCASGVSAAVATIRNTRSNTRATALLVDSGSGEIVNGVDVTIYHGIVAVWDQEESIEKNDGPCVAHGDPLAYAGSSEQDREARADPGFDFSAITDADERAAAEAAFIANFTGADNTDGWTGTSAAVIPARDGDTLIITVAGVAGSISVVVDGDAPDVESVSPASGVTKENVVNLQFTVSDDGSGLRYDQESGTSGDPDLQPVNGDGDQRFDEPITNDPEDTTEHNGDGSTADIQVYYTGTKDDAYNPVKLDENGDRIPAPDGVSATPTDDINYFEDTTTSPTSYWVLVDPAKVYADDPAANAVGLVTGRNADFHADTETSALGGNDWTQVRKGVEYSLDMRVVGNDFGTYYWQVTVKDRVGNSVTTDGDEDEGGKQPFKFTVDDKGPVVPEEGAGSRNGARTGVSYEPGVGEKADRAWIALEFVNADEGGADRIDASTVEPGDFTVGGHTVVQALVPSETKCKAAAGKTGEDLEDIDGNCLESPGSRIYLQLSEDLAADATPTIQLLGGAFKDIAGNNNVTDSFKAVDKIAPGIGITITSSTGTANRAAASDPDDDSFTVRVTSDEDLSRFPRLWFATIKGEASIEDGKAGNASALKIDELSSRINMSEVDTNTWEKKVKVSALPGSDNRILAAVITAADEASPDANPGNSAGWKGSGEAPAVNDGLDFKKLNAGDFLVEIDDELVAAVVTVRPAADPAKPEDNKTESGSPYIELNFEEADEYGIPVTDDKGTTADEDTWPEDAPSDYKHTDDDETGTAYKVDIGDGDTLRVDSHRAVTLTALSVSGLEVDQDDAVRVDPWKYVLAVSGLEIGEYDITYAAMDDVGNEVAEDDAEASFEVLERQPYEVELDPGWNLISLPGNPLDTTIGAVIGEDLKVDTVLGFQGGEWVTAVRSDDGRWMGTLGDIVGGYGYWVRTTVVESIETVIPPVRPDLVVLPSVPIVAGWNLVGVIDLEQHDTDAPGAMHNADEYLTSLGKNWRVAYSFETQQNSWSKLLPGATQNNEVQNGKGYWLWNTAPGTLVP